MESTANVAEDGYISLKVTLPHDPTAVCVDLAKVRWSTRREFGVEFLIVNGDGRERLERFIAHSPIG